jgi:hypothetical protein
VSPILRRPPETIGDTEDCLVHGQPGVLKEMSERFEGLKIKRSSERGPNLRQLLQDCVSSGVGTVLGGDAERHGMHSFAARGNDQVGVTW